MTANYHEATHEDNLHLSLPAQWKETQAAQWKDAQAALRMETQAARWKSQVEVYDSEHQLKAAVIEWTESALEANQRLGQLRSQQATPEGDYVTKADEALSEANRIQVKLLGGLRLHNLGRSQGVEILDESTRAEVVETIATSKHEIFLLNDGVGRALRTQNFADTRRA